jgi:hypothetical protein
MEEEARYACRFDMQQLNSHSAKIQVTFFYRIKRVCSTEKEQTAAQMKKPI